MESKRQKQVGKQIQKDLSEIFQRDLKSLFGDAFVTITDVKVTPDMGIARVYLSVLLSKEPAEILQLVRENTTSIRGKLGHRVRHQFRIIPELNFYLDDTAEYAQKIEDLFANLHIPPAEEES
jgi:ribosome-binding factor A